MPRRLWTIGYEGKTFDEFVGELAGAGVQLVIDVRAVAASRRPGFSKTALAAGLREQEIDYLQLRDLGTPKAGRDAARKGRTQEMRRIYGRHLETPEAELAMEQALSAAGDRRSALLCYEAEAGCCHRAMVAELLVERGGFAVTDL